MFELREFEFSGVNYYKKYCQIQGELDLVRVNEEFELSEFELAGEYCYCSCFHCFIYFIYCRKRKFTYHQLDCVQAWVKSHARYIKSIRSNWKIGIKNYNYLCLNVFAGECVGNVFNYFVFWITYLHMY